MLAKLQQHSLRPVSIVTTSHTPIEFVVAPSFAGQGRFGYPAGHLDLLRILEGDFPAEQ